MGRIVKLLGNIKRRWRALRRIWCGGLAHWLLPQVNKTTAHDWETVSAKRVCKRCGREEWLMYHAYPFPGEPASEWVRMDGGDLRWL